MIFKHSFHAMFPFLAAFSTLILSLFVLSENRNTVLNRLLSLLCFAIFIWICGFSLCYASVPADQALLWARNAYLGLIIIPPLTYHFTIELLAYKKGWKRAFFYYLLAGLMIAISRTPYFFSDIKTFSWGYYPQAGMLFPAFLVYFFIGYFASLAHLYNELKIKGAHTRRHIQSKYVFFSFVTGLFVSLDFIASYGYYFYPVGYVFMIFYIISLAYAIIKHHLFDVKIVMTRTGIFIVTYLVILIIPVGISIFGREFLQIFLKDQWWIIPLGLSTALASFAPFILSRLVGRTEEILTTRLAAKEKEADTDHLTGLLNRKAFLERGRRIMANATETAQPCALLMIDLDHFKEKNDTYGHIAGDEILKKVANRLSGLLRVDDIIGRYGGEEFILILSSAGKKLAIMVAERLRENISNAPIRAEGKFIEQTVSIGLAIYPDDGGKIEELMNKADQALYKAKDSGRNKVIAI